MFVDGRSLSGETVVADLCIFGAGAAGISLALEMASTGISILLVESGDFDFEQETQSLAEAENASFIDFPIETTRLRYFGGTTNHWSGFTAMFSQFDMLGRPFNNNESWPLTDSEMLPFYRRAAVMCELGALAFADTEACQRQAGFSPVSMGGVDMAPAISRFSPPTRFGQVYRDRIEQAQNIKVLLNSNVQELVTVDAGKRASIAEVACLGGSTFRIDARVYVVAMGGIESARLLLLSRRGQEAGLGNEHDLVGRYYADHIGFPGGAVRFADGAAMSFFTRKHTIADSEIGGIFVPKADVLLRENIGNFRIELSPASVIPGVASLSTLRSAPLAPDTLTRLGEHIGNILVDIDQVSNVVYKTVMRDRWGFLGAGKTGRAVSAGASMHISAEQQPNPQSRVVLSEQRDVFGQPKVKLQWKLQEADRRTLTRGFELFAASFAASGLGRVRMPAEIVSGDFEPLIDIACHHSGTTRMATDPKRGVVDRDCRLHATSNVYVASSAVFPTFSWVNPTLTIVALAMRLADHLKQHAWAHP